MKTKLLVWGTGSHANVVIEQCRYGTYHLLDDHSDEYKNKSWLSKYSPTNWLAFIAIGNNKNREAVFHRLTEYGYSFCNIISQAAYVSPTVSLGIGIYIAPMACVQTNSTLGDGVIINTGASIDHDGRIDDFTHISPGVHAGGHLTVGKRTWIGVGSSIVHELFIGDDVVVAGGSSVYKDLPGPVTKDNTSVLYAGNPAKLKRRNYTDGIPITDA